MSRVRPMWLRTWLVLTLGGYAALLASALAANKALAVGGLAAVVGTEFALGSQVAEKTNFVRAAGRRARMRAGSILALAAVGVITEGSAAAVSAYALGVLVIQGGVAAYRRGLSLLLEQEPPIGVRNFGEDHPARALFVRARRWRARGTILLLSFDLPLLAGVLVADESGMAAVPAAVVGTVIGAGVVTLEIWRRRFIRSGRIEQHVDTLVADLRSYDPDAVFHVPSAAWIYAVNQWMPLINTSRRRVVFVCRNAPAAEELDPTPLPVVLARRQRDLEHVLVPECRVALHSLEPHNIKDFLVNRTIKNVRLSHGDSDKAYNAQPLARAFDEIWVAGQAAIDRYEAAGIGVPAERFRIIGRYETEAIAVGPLENEHISILYAPTYEGLFEHVNYSSVVVSGAAILESIIASRPDVGIVFKPHPKTGSVDPAYAEARERLNDMLRSAPNAHLHVVADDEDGDLIEYFNRADVLLADISAVISDFLHSERPVIVTNPKRLSPDEFLARFPTQQGSYVIGPDGAEIVEALEAAVGDDPMSRSRRAMKRYTLGDLDDGPLEAFRSALDDLNERAASQVDGVPVASPEAAMREAELSHDG